MYSYPTYDIYICHSSIYSENYRKLIKLFNSGKASATDVIPMKRLCLQ